METKMAGLRDGAARLGIDLTAEQLRQFEVYYREMISWNRRINLTRITGYEDVQIKHFLDSLTIILGFSSDEPGRELKIIDAGSGAGLPGIPLKITLSGIRLTLLEATTRKAAFLKHVASELGLDDVEVVNERAETAARDEQHRERYDIVVSRAVAPLAVLAELTLPFCAVGGCLIAPKKGNISTEIEQSSTAIDILGGETGRVVDIKLEELADARCLVIVNKVSQTPAKYPRRPGIPAKRPLY